jgi:hypothetical protein
MEWRLSKSVIRGDIDNTVKGVITGRIWLVGRDEPLDLRLKGNCLRDIAGQRVRFENPEPAAGDEVDLATLQDGDAGEMTASRRIYFTDDGSDETALQAYPDGTKIGNCLCLEWYSTVNGFVTLEGPGFEVRISEPSWQMTIEEEWAQIEKNEGAFAGWMDAGDEEDADFHEPMNEFEWERNLREMDAMTDRFSKVLEKYLDHPDSERCIAREMGWTWLLDAMPVQDEENGELQSAGQEVETAPDVNGAEELVPNPLTEGVDWIRTDKGRVTHPLSARAFKFAMVMWEYCKERGLLGEKGDSDLQDMIFQTQMLSAKLAGALDSLAYDIDIDKGFIVACLKRTLALVNRSIADSDAVERKGLLEQDRIAYFRRSMLEIREEILRLMTLYRKQVI